MWKFFKVVKLSDSRAYLDTKACMESRGQTWSRLYLMVATHSCKSHARHKSTQLWGCIEPESQFMSCLPNQAPVDCVQPEREPLSTSPMAHMAYYRPEWGEQKQRELEDGGRQYPWAPKLSIRKTGFPIKYKGQRSEGGSRSFSKRQEIVKDREAWRAAVHGVTKRRTWLSDYMTTNKGQTWD